MTDLDPTVFGHFKDSLNTVIDQSKDVVPEEHPAKVVGRDEDGTLWVRIYGAEKDTPVTMAVVDALEGDLVGVKIVDGNSIMTWNTTSPAATVNQVGNVSKRVSAVAGDVYMARAKIGDLEAENATINNLIAENATITNAKIQNLEAEDARITNLVAENAEITEAAIGTLNANKANVTDLTATNGNITALVSKLAGFDTAVADFLAAEHLEVDLADIDVAAISEGWIKDLMVQGSMIVQNGTVYYLDAVEVNANNITAGTLDVQRLIITDQKTGEKYLVHFVEDPQTGEMTPVSQKMDGNVVAPRTITADKIVTGSITADEITANILAGTGSWIDFHNGTFKYMTVEPGHESDTDDQKWEASSNGISWDGSTLQIKSDDIELTSGEKITGIVTDLRTAEGEVSLLRSDVDQTAAGLSVTVTDLHAVQDYIGSPDDSNGLLHRLNEQVFATIPVYMNFTSDNGSPLLTIGGGDKWGQFKMAITNTGLDIINEATQDRPAYFTKDGLFIQQAEVVGDLYFGTGDNGGWQWTVRENGHMTLRKVR